MKRFLTALPLTLVLLLAACGGNGPTPTPPTTPVNPPTTPITPPTTPPTVPPVTPPTTPPTTPSVDYYGEWKWEFDFTRFEAHFEGQISITEAIEIESFTGSRGGYQACGAEACGATVVRWGTGLIGTFKLDTGDRLGAALRDELGGPGFIKVLGYDDDGRVSTNSRGEQVIEGQGIYYITENSDPELGNFRLTKISDLPVIQD